MQALSPRLTAEQTEGVGRGYSAVIICSHSSIDIFRILCVIVDSTTLGTFSVVFGCDKKHALSVVTES